MNTLFAMNPLSDGLQEWLEVLPRWQAELDRRLAEVAAWQVQQEELATERLTNPLPEGEQEPPVVPPLRLSIRRLRCTAAGLYLGVARRPFSSALTFLSAKT